MKCISLCGIPCLCTLSASAFIDSSLHQLDFFLEIFLWRLVNIHLYTVHNSTYGSFLKYTCSSSVCDLVFTQLACLLHGHSIKYTHNTCAYK